jgi:hypothetical protein
MGSSFLILVKVEQVAERTFPEMHRVYLMEKGGLIAQTQMIPSHN